MSVQAAIVFIMLIVLAALSVRRKLRARCLGKCAGCPYASECAAKKAAEQHPAS